jgi:hypothetical protein
MLTAGALGAFLFAYADKINEAIVQLNLSVTSTWVLLGIIAAVGAAGGLLNSYLAGSALILPSFHVLNGKLSFFPGFLGNVGSGALAAIVTVWLASPAEGSAAPPSTPSAGASAAPTEPTDTTGTKNLLTAALLISAFVAGFGGSWCATGQRDKNLLWAAAQTALNRASDPAASRAVATARTALEAFTIATGQPLPGTGPPPPAAATAKDPQVDLLLQLDPQGLRHALGGLPLSVLPAVQRLPPPQRDALKDLRLTDVAGAAFDLLKTSIPQPAGTDVAAFHAALDQSWRAAREFKSRLDNLPEDGQIQKP